MILDHKRDLLVQGDATLVTRSHGDLTVCRRARSNRLSRPNRGRTSAAGHGLRDANRLTVDVLDLDHHRLARSDGNVAKICHRRIELDDLLVVSRGDWRWSLRRDTRSSLRSGGARPALNRAKLPSCSMEQPSPAFAHPLGVPGLPVRAWRLERVLAPTARARKTAPQATREARAMKRNARSNGSGQIAYWFSFVELTFEDRRFARRSCLRNVPQAVVRPSNCQANDA